MRLDADECRGRMSAARVARLATVGELGRPHLVPITFVVDGDALYFAVDHKPKSTTWLKRLRNIEADPGVAVLADHYDEDWTQLWWVRADGQAAVLFDDRAVDLLVAKYPQYAGRPPEGPVVLMVIERWSGWSYQ